MKQIENTNLEYIFFYFICLLGIKIFERNTPPYRMRSQSLHIGKL